MVNESYSVYPNQLDGYASLPLRQNLVHEIRAEDHNRLRDAIIKIEQELGVQPSGTYATVAERLDNIADARAAIDAHMADPTDAHDASAISVADADDLFYYNNVEKVIEELGLLLPAKPDNIGENVGYIPNHGIPCFVDGYGTKFVYNISDWSAEATDNEVKRTQMRRVAGIRGIHIIDVSQNTNKGVGWLTFDQSDTTLRWQAPGDSSPGTGVDVSGLAAGEIEFVYSSNTDYALRIARNSDTLPTGPVEELLEVYSLEATSGYFSIRNAFMRSTDYITRTATSPAGVSRHQFMIKGMVFPADHGTLVLQRKRRNDDEFYPIAVLDLAANFDEDLRETRQPVYIPSLEDFDVITLFDRISAKRDYFYMRDADNNKIYENFPIDYLNTQLAHYLIPVSNSVIVGGALESPIDITEDEIKLKVSTYRIVHYKDGVTDFTGEPNESDIYSLSDPDHNESTGDNTVRFSNVYVDPNPNRPGVDHIHVTPPMPDTVDEQVMYLSGIQYYTSSTDSINRFGFRVRSNDNLFSNTYVKDKILRFKSDIFDFPSGVGEDGYSEWGEYIDLSQLHEDGDYSGSDGYTSAQFFSDIRLPEMDEIAWYIVGNIYDGTPINSGRELKIPSETFSARAHISAWFYDPFGPGDGYDGYGDADYVIFNTPTATSPEYGNNRDRILVNSYSSRSTTTKEYFTDEDYRVGESETFIFSTTKDKYTHADGFHLIGGPGDDGYVLAEWNNEIVIGQSSLQCGARWSRNEFQLCGLIWPQNNYKQGNIMPFQFDESILYPGGIDYDYSTFGDLSANYDGYGITSRKHYQRLFSLEYPVSNARLRVVSDGENKISFHDIAQYNPYRFAKIEVKIPGNDDIDSTEWMDIGRLYESGKYEEEDSIEVTFSAGALSGKPTGGYGDFIVPFTFGRRNNANAGNMIAVRVTYFGTANDHSKNVLADTKTRIITMLELLPPVTSES